MICIVSWTFDQITCHAKQTTGGPGTEADTYTDFGDSNDGSGAQVPAWYMQQCASKSGPSPSFNEHMGVFGEDFKLSANQALSYRLYRFCPWYLEYLYVTRDIDESGDMNFDLYGDESFVRRLIKLAHLDTVRDDKGNIRGMTAIDYLRNAVFRMIRAVSKTFILLEL